SRWPGVPRPRAGGPVGPARVPAPAGTPGARAPFSAGTTAIGTATLDAGGQVVFATAFRTAGSHTLTAVFNGTPAFAPSRSAALLPAVSQAATTTTLTASANPAPARHPLVLTPPAPPAFTAPPPPPGL